MRLFVEQLESRTHLSLPGDANGDGRVDSRDFAAVALHYNGAASGVVQGDFNADAKCNALDFSILAYNFGGIEVSDTAWLGSIDGDLTNDGNWSSGAPSVGVRPVFDFTNTPWATPPSGALIGTFIGINIANGNGLDFSGGDVDLSSADLGDSIVNNVEAFAPGSLFGNLTASNINSSAFVGSFTGSAKTISCSAGTLDLGTSTVPANYVLSVSGGASIHNFTQLRASGQQAKYATVTGGVEQSHAQQSTISGTYDTSFGFLPTGVFDQDDGFVLDNFSASGGTWSAKLSNAGSDVPSPLSLELVDSVKVIILNLDTITVTAASSSASRLIRVEFSGLINFGLVSA